MEDLPIRSTCFRPFQSGWIQPSAEEVRELLRKAKLTGAGAAGVVGISDSRTVRRWTSGDTVIPYAAWAILCDHAGIEKIWSATSAGSTT